MIFVSGSPGNMIELYNLDDTEYELVLSDNRVQ
jgi:hypothetical protein